MLTDPRTILTSLKTLLEAIRLPSSYGADVAAFNEVRIYDLEDLLKAIQELLTFKHRVAFVILENVQHENVISGRAFTVKRRMDVTVLLADRHWGDRQKALMGTSPEAENGTPGAVQLSHLVVNALTGEQSGLIVEPGTGEIFALEGPTRDNATGRIAWRQEFTITAGRVVKQLSRLAD